MTHDVDNRDSLTTDLDQIVSAADAELGAGIKEDAQLQASGCTLDTHDEEIKYLDREAKRVGVTELLQNVTERKKYAHRIYCLICFWLAAVLLIVIASGCHNVEIEVPEPVLLALITGLSVNVLGIFIFVVKYLFPSK